MTQWFSELCCGCVFSACNHPFWVYICCKKLLCCKYMWICNFGRDVPLRRRSSGSVESMNIRPNVQMFCRTFAKHSTECSVQPNVPPACLNTFFIMKIRPNVHVQGAENVYFDWGRLWSFEFDWSTLSRVDRSIGKVSLLFMLISRRFIC